MHKFSKTFDILKATYDDRVTRFGCGPEAVHWADRESQERRFRLLSEIDDVSNSSVLDFGCGDGELLHYLSRECSYTGRYIGYDISPLMIELASARFSDGNGSFICGDILEEGVNKPFDYGIVSGTFNLLTGNNEEWMYRTLRVLFEASNKGVAFNALSSYVDYRDEGLFYIDPEEVFKFCKSELSPFVCLRHDYAVRSGVIPFEFTVYVRKFSV